MGLTSGIEYTLGVEALTSGTCCFCYLEGAIQLRLLSASDEVAFWLLSLAPPPFPPSPLRFPCSQIIMNKSFNSLAS